MRVLFGCLMCLLGARSPVGALTIPTVPVGNPGNAGELSGADAGGVGLTAVVGGVNYRYRIGKNEVTNSQYAEFLSAKAVSDPLGLYSPYMGVSNPGLAYLAGITRSGDDGSYFYEVVPGRENKPVGGVNWYNAIRFTNWLSNGQGDGDTETGAYTLGPLDESGLPISPGDIVRNPDAKWFLPSEDEWYKAAYYNPQSGTYFDYPTGSDTAPAAEAPPGGSNSANYSGAVPSPYGDFTDVGSYVGSASPYGTFDQGGNVLEWTETPIGDGFRIVRGGTAFNGAYLVLLQAKDRPLANYNAMYQDFEFSGFRVATIPEPSSAVLGAIGLAGLLWYARRRNRAR